MTTIINVRYSGSAIDRTWTSDAKLDVVRDGDAWCDSVREGWYDDDDIEFLEETAEEVAQRCGIDGSLTECHLLIYALRKYAAICDLLGIRKGSEWTPFSPAELDDAGADDYEALCDAIDVTFGHDAASGQRAALAGVLSTDYLASHSITA